MLTILLHTSKTMRKVPESTERKRSSILFNEEVEILSTYLKSLSTAQVQKVMSVSEKMAETIKELIQDYDTHGPTLPAIDIFLGDIYSGLQVHSFSQQDRHYAHEHLYILSGLYGVLKALDEIQPYRLEMGYKLQNFKSLYEFWSDKLAKQLPKDQDIINLSAVEYTKAVFPYLKKLPGYEGVKIISPKFLTVSSKTGEPTFVTVHAKVARGAFARWLIQNRIEALSKLKEFNDVGYRYDAALSTPDTPVFVAQEFKGIGLSVRLT